jgi:hypothetical protein
VVPLLNWGGATLLLEEMTMAMFDVDVCKTIHRNFFLEAETKEEAETIAMQLAAEVVDLNEWIEYTSEFQAYTKIVKDE